MDKEVGFHMNRGVGMAFQFPNGLYVSVLVGDPGTDSHMYSWVDENGMVQHTHDKYVCPRTMHKKYAWVMIFDELHDREITDEYVKVAGKLARSVREIADVLVWAENYRREQGNG